ELERSGEGERVGRPQLDPEPRVRRGGLRRIGGRGHELEDLSRGGAAAIANIELAARAFAEARDRTDAEAASRSELRGAIGHDHVAAVSVVGQRPDPGATEVGEEVVPV